MADLTPGQVCRQGLALWLLLVLGCRRWRPELLYLLGNGSQVGVNLIFEQAALSECVNDFAADGGINLVCWSDGYAGCLSPSVG